MIHRTDEEIEQDVDTHRDIFEYGHGRSADQCRRRTEGEKVEKFQAGLEQEQACLEAMRVYDDRMAVEFQEPEADFDDVAYSFDEED